MATFSFFAKYQNFWSFHFVLKVDMFDMASSLLLLLCNVHSIIYQRKLLERDNNNINHKFKFKKEKKKKGNKEG